MQGNDFKQNIKIKINTCLPVIVAYNYLRFSRCECIINSISNKILCVFELVPMMFAIGNKILKRFSNNFR